MKVFWSFLINELTECLETEKTNETKENIKLFNDIFYPESFISKLEKNEYPTWNLKEIPRNFRQVRKISIIGNIFTKTEIFLKRSFHTDVSKWNSDENGQIRVAYGFEDSLSEYEEQIISFMDEMTNDLSCIEFLYERNLK